MTWLENETLVFGVTVLVQIAGVVSMAIARISECSTKKCRYQAFFFTSLFLVGIFSALMIQSGTTGSVLCAATLPVMAVGATLDLRTNSADTPF